MDLRLVGAVQPAAVADGPAFARRTRTKTARSALRTQIHRVDADLLAVTVASYWRRLTQARHYAHKELLPKNAIVFAHRNLLRHSIGTGADHQISSQQPY